MTHYYEFCDLVSTYADNVERNLKPHGELVKAFESLTSGGVDSSVRPYFKLLTQLSKTLLKLQTSPAKKELTRVKLVISRASIYITRVIKRTD